jgi:hypothetical protein
VLGFAGLDFVERERHRNQVFPAEPSFLFTHARSSVTVPIASEQGAIFKLRPRPLVMPGPDYLTLTR